MDGYYAWMIVATALVLMMTTPALALFYGGMSRSKSVLNMMMMSYVSLGIVGIVYVLWGWSMSFGPSDVAGLFANPFSLFGLKDVGWDSYIAVAFQMTFAVITAVRGIDALPGRSPVCVARRDDSPQCRDVEGARAPDDAVPQVPARHGVPHREERLRRR